MTGPQQHQPGEPVYVLYEFNLSCGHIERIRVDSSTHEPIDADGKETGVYRCPVCGAEERARSVLASAGEANREETA